MSQLTLVQRRPGSGTILQKFINFGGADDGESVEQSFERLVVPALQAKHLLVGRDWGRLTQCEVLLKNDSDAGLIEVDQVRVRGLASHLQTLLRTSPGATHTRVCHARGDDHRDLGVVAAFGFDPAVHQHGAQSRCLHGLASWSGAGASCFIGKQLGAIIGYSASNVDSRWATRINGALRAAP